MGIFIIYISIIGSLSHFDCIKFKGSNELLKESILMKFKIWPI